MMQNTLYFKVRFRERKNFGACCATISSEVAPYHDLPGWQGSNYSRGVEQYLDSFRRVAAGSGGAVEAPPTPSTSFSCVEVLSTGVNNRPFVYEFP
jgi:hypothetical protein